MRKRFVISGSRLVKFGGAQRSCRRASYEPLTANR